ncbi:MAG: hypothetical protein P8L66_14120 [Rhodospirillaceae bacterium]|nr:hypothetical protein [Rhodospirillaceae bacterium]
MSDSSGAVWVIVVSVAFVAFVAFVAYSLSDANDEDDAIDAVIVGADSAIVTSTDMDRPVSQGGGNVQQAPKQIRMNANLQAAKTEAMERMQKLVEKASEPMKSGKNHMPNAMGRIMGDAEKSIPK